MDQQKPGAELALNIHAKKIIVIGSGGSGKSTFARQLGKILELEVIHLDALYWKPGWIKPSEQEWRQTVERAVVRDSWVIDGNYSGTLDLRVEACDMIVFLDVARLTCLWRVLKRSLQYRNKSRPDMAEGCPEKIDWAFIGWVWGYPTRTRPRVLRLIKENPNNKKVVWLQSDAETEAFLANLRKG